MTFQRGGQTRRMRVPSCTRAHFCQASVSVITVGSHVWLEDDELAWVEGNVQEVNATEVKALTRKGKLVHASIQNVHLRDRDVKPGGVDDMTKLAYLHEPGLLHNLACRYELDEIYTYTGNILIAVNPFAKLPHLYDAHMMEQYRGSPLGELSPHVFAIADTAYRAMIDKKCSQSILVSGESGAGKTETTKVIMQYLAYMGGRAATDGRTVEQQVLESNPLLEAFGNAKTIRNDNSSRFGKFIEIQFDHGGRISGAAVRTYLLERSRVVQISDPERNYHCFYQLCASPEDAQKYKLSDAATFHYLNQSQCFELVGTSNGREYLKTRRAMDIVGIAAEEQEAIFRIVASILHIGNVEFVYGKDAESSKLKDEKSLFHLQTAAELLMCDCQSFRNSMCTRIIATRDENITKTLDPASATVNRDTLAKTIYTNLFDWLVKKINKSIGQDTSSSNVIGVLDIYGFETFECNSFEQFCINLANEKLQQHFNQHVFKMEQEDYSKEAINWSYIEFIDNQDVLDLIEGKPLGIIPLLDEACMFPKSTHETFSTKLSQLLRGQKRFSKPRLAHTDFTIRHYAGEVTYQTNLFLEKNKDYIVAEHRVLLGSSKCSFVSGLFPPLSGDCIKSSYKFSSIATGFKQQLHALMDTLNSTEPHYIRCVKPNVLNRPGCFDSRNVLHQLRCGGVLEAVRISCAGYPTRRSLDEFLDRFSLLAPEILEGNYDEKKAIEKLLIKMRLKNYQIGKTKIFLRAGQMAELDARRAAVLTHAAKVIQNQVRTFVARQEFRAMHKAAVCIQAIWRGKCGRKLFDTIRKEAAAVLIQKYVRRWECRKLFEQIRLSVIIIQSGVRGLFARNEYRLKRRTKGATLIQAQWRGSVACAYYRQLRKAAVIFQCGWRCRTARRELRRLKLAAKETGALQEAKTKLEKRCEELTWRLQLEKRLRSDAEELKTQEIARLKACVQEMKGHMGAASDMLQKERMLHKEALEQAFVSAKELSATNTKMKEVMAENSKLKASNFYLERKAIETEQNLYAFQKESEDCQLKANLKIQQLQESTLKLEERLSNLQSENQVLRQQALTLSPTNGLNPVHPVSYQWSPSNGHISNGDLRDIVETPPSVQIVQHRKEVDGMQLKFSTDRQQENQDALLQCVMQDIGFSQDRPVAACIIYKSLLHWRSFEAERTNVFDHIIQIIGKTIESQENNDVLAYWLSNTSTLLFLLQRTLKASPVAPSIQRRRTSSVLFGHLTQDFRSSPSGATSISSGGTVKGSVEAKYPAMLFKQQLTAYVEKIYGLIRDNLKKEITPFLGLCIQAPRNTRASLAKVTINSLKPYAATCQSLSSHWSNITERMAALLNTLRANHVPSFLVRKLFKQIFSFVNVQLFNSLLLRRECCSFSNGEYVKAGLVELEHWICEASDKHTGKSWEELKYIRQAVGFLVIHQKPKKSLDEITDDLCPSLSIQQLYRISTMYWDDKYGTHSVSPEIIASMRILMADNAGCNSFLLDDDTSIPFTVDEILSSIEEVDLSDLDLPPFLRDNPAFTFLLLQAE